MKTTNCFENEEELIIKKPTLPSTPDTREHLYHEDWHENVFNTPSS